VGVTGCYKGHGDPIDADRPTGGEVGEIRGNRSPTHIAGFRADIAEMYAVYEDVGIDQNGAGIGSQSCTVVVELAWRSKAGEPS
jgi:hypothetical protein